MFQIISDGGCDFSTKEVKKHNIDIVPFYISFDGSTYLKEGTEIVKEDYFKRLSTEKNLFPKTAQPNPYDYIEACTPHLKNGKDILILTISSKLSGSNNSAMIAKETLKEDFVGRKIIVIDSLSASIAQGLILREIIKMRNAGYSLEKTEKIAKEILKTTRAYITLDSLEYARRGGRIGPTTALVGNILKLRPILHLQDGRVEQLDNVRGKKNAIKLIEEAMVETLKDEVNNINLSIGHILSETDATSFKAKTEAALSIKIENPITEVGATIGTHAGPGALVLSYCRKYETFKSLGGNM